MPEVFDLLIENGDLVFGSDGEPEYVINQAAVAQDMKHRIKESGLPVKLVGTRGDENQAALQQIKMVAKEEERVKPDSVEIEEADTGSHQVTGETLDGYFIETELT